VKDSLLVRWFSRVAFQRVPDARTLWRWEQPLRPETIPAQSVRMLPLAKPAKGTKGRKLRLDATWVQTTRPQPTASGVRVESVRVRARFVPRANALVTAQLGTVQPLCRARLRSARRVAQTLHRPL